MSKAQNPYAFSRPVQNSLFTEKKNTNECVLQVEYTDINMIFIPQNLNNF